MMLHASTLTMQQKCHKLKKMEGILVLKEDWNCLKFIVVDIFPATLVTPCVS